jgi:hypothetical protein
MESTLSECKDLNCKFQKHTAYVLQDGIILKILLLGIPYSSLAELNKEIYQLTCYQQLLTVRVNNSIVSFTLIKIIDTDIVAEMKSAGEDKHFYSPCVIKAHVDFVKPQSARWKDLI